MIELVVGAAVLLAGILIGWVDVERVDLLLRAAASRRAEP